VAWSEIMGHANKIPSGDSGIEMQLLERMPRQKIIKTQELSLDQVKVYTILNFI
jgi:hypothetical protein